MSAMAELDAAISHGTIASLIREAIDDNRPTTAYIRTTMDASGTQQLLQPEEGK